MHNPDADFIRAFIANPSRRLMETNSLLKALRTELISFDVEKTEITLKFRPDEMFRQGAGNIQGGIISAMLDFAMGLAGFAVIPPDASMSTTSMNTSFFSPGTANEFTAIGCVEKPGRRLVFTAAKLYSNDRMIAGATSTLIVLPAPAKA